MENSGAPDENRMENDNITSNEEIAVTTVTRDSYYYNMNHTKQGVAFIFTHEKFRHQVKRNAAEVDDKKLKKCLLNLGFNVNIFKDLKVAEIDDQIQQALKMDHSNNNCFVLVVLSHGDENLVEAFDRSYNPSEMFWGKFTADKCPTLAGKPKLFFMQCCQGEKLDSGIKLHYIQSKTETDGGNDLASYRIPIHSDFCIMYATARGHFAFRNDIKGSYFITALCEELEKHVYHEHLLTILTFVIRRVAVEFQSRTKEVLCNKKKQIPYFESSLTRLVQFVDKGNKENTSFIDSS